MRISVISPSFNQAQFLPDNLRSVSEQQGVDLEHIIVDPGSTDGSTELAHAATHATLIAEPDRGQSHGITKGFERCTGDVMTWLNSDDFYPSRDTLRKVADIFEAHADVDIVYGGVNFVGTDGEFLRKGFVNPDADGLLASFQHQVGIVQPGVFWRRRVFEDLSGPSEDYEYCMDYELWVRMADAGFKWHYIDEVLAHHRWWGGMKTASGRGQSLIEHFRVGARYFGYIHWKWLDRYAEYCATSSDGVVNHATVVNETRKAEFARSTIERFVSQDMLALLDRSDHPEHRATLDYIHRMAPAHQRVMFTDEDLPDRIHEHSDPKAEERIAWHIFDTTTPGSDRRYKSYRVPQNFSRHFDADWYEQQSIHAQKRLSALSESRKDTCVVVANGPSLNKSNLSLLDRADVIVSNFATISEGLRTHATYFTVVNDLVAVQGSTVFNQLEIPRLVPFWLANAINPGENTIYLPATVVPEFCSTPDGLFSWRSTVSFYNMQLAYALGYEKVVLIGFDHSYVQAEALKEGDAIEQKSEDPNHFDPRYFQGKTWQAADTGNMEKMYEVAFDSYRKAGRSIVNATEGGKLEVFPRMTLETALGTVDPTAARHALPPMRDTAPEAAPRLLIFDMTMMGGGTATGEVKASLLGDWPANRILQVAWTNDGLSLVRRNTDDSWTSTPTSEVAINQAIETFEPEVLLYRPVPNVPQLHRFAMETIDRLNLPLVSWIMDDWPTQIARSDPEQWAVLEPDLERLLDCASLNLSICNTMTEAFSARYGKPFRAFANGVDPVDWPHPKPHENQKLLLRYAGGLAPNMTRDSVLRVARAVEDLADAGHDIRFEINTQSWWYEQSKDLFADLHHTRLETQTRSPEAYRNWLRSADAVVIAYNFDTETLRYVRYSMANKMPECLASGATLIAHGPTDIATIGYLATTGAAEMITTDNDNAVRGALLALLRDPQRRTRLAQTGHSLATSQHALPYLRQKLRAALVGACHGTAPAEKADADLIYDLVGNDAVLLLRYTAAELLLRPLETLNRIRNSATLRDELKKALATLPDTHQTKQHYQYVTTHAATSSDM
ncbi:MAG: glycosyltransferase [Pseudomonadota bacterium]